MHRFRIYVWFVALLTAGTHIYGSVTTCQTPQNVHFGQPGTIKCSFPDRVENKQFLIYKYDLNSTEDEEERVVDCYMANNQRHCDVSSGFDFTCTNGSEQTVSIPNVTTRHEGTYVCRPIPVDGECKPCVLEVKVDQILEDKQKQEWNAVINDHRVTEGMTDDRETSTPVIAGIVGGVAGLIVVCCVVGAIVYWKKRRGERQRKKRSEKVEKMVNTQYGDNNTELLVEHFSY